MSKQRSETEYSVTFDRMICLFVVNITLQSEYPQG